jgi:hypothetical protein
MMTQSNPFREAIQSLFAGATVRQLRIREKRHYHFQPEYELITGTERHCFRHPQNLATHFELNTQDKSYRRPVCDGCAQ